MMSRPRSERCVISVSVVLVQLEIPLTVVQRVAEVCQECELRLVLDPAPAQSMPLEVWRGVSVVKPNELEAEVLTGISVTDLSSAEQAARWFLDRGVTIAMITRGPHGAVLVGPDGVAEYPAFPATPVDTTAAGDAFSGAFGASLARGASLPDALRRGLAAGALAVTVRGASPACPPPRQSMRFWPLSASRLVSVDGRPGDHRR